jgi:uncharacterized protein (TIGR00369 family)
MGVGDLERKVRENFGRQAFMTTLGAEMTLVQSGEVDIQFAYRASLTQQHGFVHAGAITGILDSACGYAALSVAPEGYDVLSVEFKVNLLAPAVGGTVHGASPSEARRQKNYRLRSRCIRGQERSREADCVDAGDDDECEANAVA